MHSQKAVLLYLGGHAHVFAVKSFGETPNERYAVERLLQGRGDECYYFALGLVAAGIQVETMACTSRDEITEQAWSYDISNIAFAKRVG
jgi:hypothetical protein